MGYVGRDVESMVRDLVGVALTLVKKEYRTRVEAEAARSAEERLLDLLLPSTQAAAQKTASAPQDLFRMIAGISQTGTDSSRGLSEAETTAPENEGQARAREQMRERLRAGSFEDKEVELDVQTPASPMVQVLAGQNMEEIDMQMQNMLGDLLPKRQKKRRLTIAEARKILTEEEADRLVDPDRIQSEAVRRAEQMGIIFIDEIDKVTSRGGSGSGGPDVSREGVQRDLLPIVEGATVTTRQGPVKTDHILFIAAGAFHNSRPSDLIPELQGRFPIRVELEKLTEKDFRMILTGPRNSLTRQAQALLGTEGVELEFTEDGLDELARTAYRVNEGTENIGARRLHTIMERLLEDVSFHASDLDPGKKKIRIDAAFVHERLKTIVENRDLSRYIL